MRTVWDTSTFFYLPFIEKPKFPITNTTRTNATERIIAGKSRDLICDRQMRQYKDHLLYEQEYSRDIYIELVHLVHIAYHFKKTIF